MSLSVFITNVYIYITFIVYLYIKCIFIIFLGETVKKYNCNFSYNVISLPGMFDSASRLHKCGGRTVCKRIQLNINCAI